MKRPAVFIDRDGTISEEVGYLDHPSRLDIYPYSSAAIKLLNSSGWLAIVITNQSGVARGYFSEDVLVEINDRLTQLLHKDGATVDAVYYCAHHPTIGAPPYRQHCKCRKPGTGLIRKANLDFDIDLGSSWVIGDRYTDVALARNAGLHSALVLSGYGHGEWEYQRASWATQPDIVAQDLLQAVTSILSSSAPGATIPYPSATEVTP
jgi:D-glycero-D-manno-heptose 1,7-bisphosphate phosphatase